MTSTVDRQWRCIPPVQHHRQTSFPSVFRNLANTTEKPVENDANLARASQGTARTLEKSQGVGGIGNIEHTKVLSGTGATAGVECSLSMSPCAPHANARDLLRFPPSPQAVGTAMTRQMQAGAAELLDRSPDRDRWGELMLQSQDGDRMAYRTLLHQIAPHVRSITRHYLGRGEDAEDALQDVLMIIHGIRHTYEGGRPFKPWLNTIAARRCIDLLRRRAHRLRHEIAEENPADGYAQATHGPEEAVSRLHAAGALHQAVAALPERQREAIRLLRLNELSLNEAAAKCDQSVGSLKVACHRALKSLHRALAKNGANP